MSFPPRSWGRPRVDLFAVEPHAVQLTWSGLGAGPIRVDVRPGPGARVVAGDGGPGGVVVDGLVPGTPVDIAVHGPGLAREGVALRARPPEPPPGPERFRFATVSDLHLGATRFGLTRRMRERGHPTEPHPLRCARAALAEALAWGAELVVVKGDLVDEGHPEQWVAADALLGGLGVPVEIVPGNHEVRRGRLSDPPSHLGGGTVEITRGVKVRDVPGLRMVLIDTTILERGHGRVHHHADALDAALADAPTPVWIGLHHHPQRFALPWFWPPGIPGREARRFLQTVAHHAPDALVTTGHTHRNRRHDRHPPLVTEVCSTKDYPGGWAGYTVHDGGIVQTVRRTLDPSAMAWTEYTRHAVGGVWGRWAPGRVDDRCLVHRWDLPTGAAAPQATSESTSPT